MFSRRTAWDRSTNRLAERVEQARLEGSEVLDLTETNPTRAGISYPAAGILSCLAHPEALDYDPDPRGGLAARQAICEIYAARGIAVQSEDILLTASTSEAYGWLFKLLADPGEEVLIPRPSYPLFQYLSGLEGIETIAYPIHWNGAWEIGQEALSDAVTPRTRALVVVSPNNPTGNYVKRRELEGLAALAAGGRLALIGDEVFAEYPLVEDPARAASVLEAEGALSFSLGGLSKLAGLPQMKLGWIAVGGPAELRREARQRLEIVADTYLSVGTPVQKAAPALLKAGFQVRGAIRARTRANLKTLQAVIPPSSGCQVLPCEGGWSAVLRVPAIMTEEEWVLTLLEKERVLVHPGYFFDFASPAYLVLSLLPREADFREGVSRILARLAGHGRSG
jgi:aspartate/methionine/tyrosine aminotransferase